MAAVTAFVFPGLNGAGHLADDPQSLHLTGFASRWRTVASAFAAAPGFAAFDRALHAGTALPGGAATWPWRALAVVAMQLAAAEALEQRGERAAWLCGYSVGDLARSCHARVFGFAELVAFAAALPTLPVAAGSTAGAVLPDAAAARALRTALRAVAVDACRLSPRVLLLAGTADALSRARDLAARCGGRLRDVGTCPLHSALQRGVAALLAAALRSAHLLPPQRPMFSTLWGRAIAPHDDLRRELVANIAAPIDFARAIERLHAQHGVARFVDLGPGRHAQRFVQHHGAALTAVHCSDLLAPTAIPA